MNEPTILRKAQAQFCGGLSTYNPKDRSPDRSDMSSWEEPPKKKRVRARLDHLTPNEKLQRRKLKNRIAAQTARDRKRAKIDHLEEENRKLREENLKLKSQLKISTSTSGASPLSIDIVDSGISDFDSNPKTSDSGTPKGNDSAAMDLLTIPQKSSENSPISPRSSATSGAFTASPTRDSANDYYLDSVVGEADESSLINDILRLQDSLNSGHGIDTSFESAELISAPQQQVQEVSYQSQLQENSAGWTSIQLMLLLMISRVHNLYSSRINCCATSHESQCGRDVQKCSNLYDYILQSKCIDFRRAAEAIISNKHNIRQQQLSALEFVYIYLIPNRFEKLRKGYH